MKRCTSAPFAQCIGVLSLGIALALLPGIAAAEPEQLDNSATPTHGYRSTEARELWRIGGEDDTHFFGVIARAFTGPGGNTYLVDSQPQRCIATVLPRGSSS